MIEKKTFPLTTLVDELIKTHARFSTNAITRAYDEFGFPWANEFEAVLKAIFSNPMDMEQAIRGYGAFSIKSMRMQAVFEKKRAYPLKTHRQATEEVYLNEEKMIKEYLPGLLLSHFLWPHHYLQLQYFKHMFISQMQCANARSFTEIGVGTGLYSYLLLESLPEISGRGIDISPAVKKFVEQYLTTGEKLPRYQLDLKNIMTGAGHLQTDWLVCIEVLEHLDDPLAFLKTLRKILNEGGKAFITAALNAAHEDHIFLYKTPDETRLQLVNAGFTIEQTFSALAYRPTSPGQPVPEVAAFIVS